MNDTAQHGPDRSTDEEQGFWDTLFDAHTADNLQVWVVLYTRRPSTRKKKPHSVYSISIPTHDWQKASNILTHFSACIPEEEIAAAKTIEVRVGHLHATRDIAMVLYGRSPEDAQSLPSLTLVNTLLGCCRAAKRKGFYAPGTTKAEQHPPEDPPNEP